MYYHKLQKISIKRQVKREHCAVSVLDREMEKPHIFGKVFVWERYRIGITYYHLPIPHKSLQDDGHFSTHFISSWFFSLRTSAFCPHRTQVCHLMCNPIKQASIIAPYVGWQSVCTQPAHDWVLATRWLHISYRFKREDTERWCNLFYSQRPSWREEGAQVSDLAVLRKIRNEGHLSQNLPLSISS